MVATSFSTTNRWLSLDTKVTYWVDIAVKIIITMSNPSLSWQKIQNVYYSLRDCYEKLEWNIRLSEFRVKLNRYSTLVAVTDRSSRPNVIDIYSANGKKIWQVIFNSTSAVYIIDYIFYREDLVVIFNTGTVRHYRDFEGSFDEYDINSQAIKLDDFGDSNPLTKANDEHVITNLENNTIEKVSRIQNSYIWSDFLFVRYSDKFIITNLITHQNFEILVSESQNNAIHYLNVSSHDTDNNTLSIVISFDTTLLTLVVDFKSSSFEIIDHKLTDGPFDSIKVSDSGKLISLLNKEKSTIYVINDSFSQILLEYDTSNDSSLPYQIEWCGNDAIVLSLRDEIKLVGPNQNSISFFYDVDDDIDFDNILKGNDLSFTIPILNPQPDGLHVLTSAKFEFLTRVRKPTLDLYQIGSSHPSSLLLDCINKLTQQSSKADNNISVLKTDNTLDEAISCCCQAVIEEFNPHWQKKVLSAISFGKAYMEDDFNADDYLTIVNTLKVLNQLRSIDLFLTLDQIQSIGGWEIVIDMLLHRNLHFLALKVIDLLQLNQLTDKVYIHWCCFKIKKEPDLDDLKLYRIISKKLISARDSVINYLSVVKISQVAYEEGRIELCKLLIGLEPSTINKIQQYLKFDEIELALIKSFQSGDYDLSKLVLLHLFDSLSISQFFKILHQNESIMDVPKDIHILGETVFVSGDLVESFWYESIGKYNDSILETYFKQEDKTFESYAHKLKKFILNEEKDDYYEEYKHKLQPLLAGKNLAFFRKELEILDLQKRLTDTYQTNFYEFKTLSSILVKLIKMNQLKQGHKVIKEFKVSQEKFWYLILETYCKEKEFVRLHQFITSNNFKPPIDFTLIVDNCLAYKCPPDYISVYINHCTDIHYLDKINMYIRNDDLLAAANEAFKYKDIEFLRSILDRANKFANDSVIDSIKALITKLGY